MVNSATSDAADRNGDVKRRDGRHRRHAQTFEAVEKIQVAEIDHAERDTENDRPVEYFEEQSAVAGHRFSEHGKIEMIVAPSRRGDADEDPVDEEGHHRFLGNKPGMPDGARDDVSRARVTLKPVMQMPHRIISRFSRGSSARHFRWRCSSGPARQTASSNSGFRSRIAADGKPTGSPHVTQRIYCTLRTSPRTFTACGTEVRWQACPGSAC